MDERVEWATFHETTPPVSARETEFSTIFSTPNITRFHMIYIHFGPWNVYDVCMCVWNVWRCRYTLHYIYIYSAKQKRLIHDLIITSCFFAIFSQTAWAYIECINLFLFVWCIVNYSKSNTARLRLVQNFVSHTHGNQHWHFQKCKVNCDSMAE